MSRDDLDSEGGPRPKFGSRRKPPLAAAADDVLP